MVMVRVIQVLDDHAAEESTFPITVNLADKAGTPIVPLSGAKWHLSTLDGTIINERENQAFPSLASSVTFLLQGDDLAMLTQDTEEERYLTLECRYNSDLGSNLPFNGSVKFCVDALPVIGD